MVIKIGHRGAMGYEPENTLLSFEKALELNVDMIELDVHRCKTGELVVIHDDKINRTTNGRGYIAKETVEELRSLDAGKGQKIPTLQEALDLVDRKAKLNIELKGKGTAKAVFDVIENYVKKKGWSYNDFFISSFNHNELLEFSKLNQDVKLGVLVKKAPTYFTERFKVHSINLDINCISKKLVDDIHKRGMKIFVWVVNDFEDIKRMRGLGVDGIFSDYPDRL